MKQLFLFLQIIFKIMIVIKKANEKLISTIADFQIKMAWESEGYQLDKERINKGVKAVFDDENKGQYFVAYDDNTVIASLLITYEWSDWRNAWVWWIQSVYVLPEYRRKGVFSSMYQHVKSKVEQNENIAGLRLYVEKENVRAISTYKKIGMTDEHYNFFEWMKF